MLVGRTREIELAQKALNAGAIVALVGPSGVGKTTIAREIGRRTAGSLLVDCFGISNEELPAHVAEALGGTTTASLDELLGDVSLLVLDDCSSEILLPTIREHYDGPILVTAHSVPDGASALPVHPFELVEGDDLEETAAFELFTKEAERVRLGAMDECSSEAISEIVRHVNGNPLGIVLAAQHAAAIGAAEVARLMRHGVELRDESRSPRQQSMAVALRFSWEQLGPDHQRLFYVASRFRRPLRVTMLAELADLELSRALTLVKELTQRGALGAGTFPRPAASWREVAVERFRAESERTAATIDDEIFQRAVATAREHDDRADIPAIDDGPSLWEAALEGYEIRPPSEVGIIAVALLRWSSRWAAKRFAPDFLEAEIDYSEHWPALMRRARMYSHDWEREAPILERALDVAQTDQEYADTYFFLAMNGLRRPDSDYALEMLEKARAHSETFLVLLLGIVTHMSRGEMDEGRELLRTLHARGEPPTQEHKWGLRVYDTWAAPPSKRLGLAEETVEMAAEAPPATRALACRTLADVLEHDHRMYARARTAREQADAFAQLQGGARVVTSTRAERGWGELVAGEPAAAREFFEDLDLAALYPETKARLHIARTMLHLLDDDVVFARQELEAAKRPTLHVPPLDDVLRVMTIAVALQAGEDANPDDDLGELMAKVHAAKHLARREQLDTFNEVAKLRVSGGWASRFAEIWIDRQAPEVFDRLRRLAAVDARVVLLEDFSGVHIDGEWHYAAETSASLLSALSCGVPLTFEEIAEAVWPGEVIDWESLVNRVSVHVSRTRRLGLKSVLVKTSDGFSLDCSVYVEGR